MADIKIVATRKREQNKAVVDPWTVVHFAAGLASGLVSIPPEVALGAAVGYEVVEQWFERQESGKELFDVSGPETISNAAVDVGVFALGYAWGALWNRS